MASNTREFYKKQLEELSNSQLLEVMHGTPIGLMSTNVGNDRMKIALELLQERWNVLETRVAMLELKAISKASKDIKISVATGVPTVTGKRGRGRPKEVKVG